METIIDLAIEADLFVRFQQVGNTGDDGDVASRKMPVYLSIFAIAQYVLPILSPPFLLSLSS